MITSRITNQIHRIELAVTGTPEITDAFDERVTITGVRLTFRGPNRDVTAIRFRTADGNDPFLSDEDMAPDNWPTWLRDLIDQYRPAEFADGCPDCSNPPVGDRVPSHHPRCPRNDPNF